jgi:hypothetical protein
MNRDFLTRFLSVGALAIIIGLISARIPSISEVKPSFSWGGLFVGSALVVGAFLLSRFFVAGAEVKSQQASPLQRFLLNLALVCLLVALVLFVAILYTHWAWPRFVLSIAVVCGALSVLAGVITTFLRRSN